MTLYLLQYDNYYNRRPKKFDTLVEYQPYIVYTLTTTNFNPRDGITTQHTFNYTGPTPDYCLVVDEHDNIISRWYITECHYNNGSQFVMSLYRDVVSDNLDKILAAPCFIEKATVTENDPAIFNSESMTFNQVKRGEYQLTDKSEAAWLVMYKSKSNDPGTKTFTIGGDSSAINIGMPITSFGLYEYSNLATTPKELRSNPNYERIFTEVHAEGKSNSGNFRFMAEWRPGQTRRTYLDAKDLSPQPSLTVRGLQLSARSYAEAFTYNLVLSLYSQAGFMTWYYDKAGIKADISNYLYYNGLRIKTSDNRYFTCSVTPKQQSTNTYFNYVTSSDATLYAMFSNNSPNHDGSPNNTSFGICVDYIPYEVVLTEELGGTQCSFNGELLAKTTDAAYDMMCLPYAEDFSVITADGTYHITKETAMQTMSQLATKYGSFCYDVQLLPYCPIGEFVSASGELDLRNHSEMYQYVLVSGTSTQLFPIMACPKAKFSGQVKYRLPGKDESIKIQNECDMYRICSPNYSGQFEFSPAKNRSARGGTDFEFDCFYQPYQPYIHVAPIFNLSGLYGRDFNDARGLICGGDFSLPVVGSKWEEYQIQNKNFQNIFDRQIQNMEVNNSIAMTQAKWGIAAGAVAGTMQGAKSGSFGGAVGTALGAAVGAGASLIGGAADLDLLKRQQAEALDYSKDLFGYQLGNIQAMPNTLTKVSSFNPNNKVFPFLEYYTCMGVERQALIDKITYNGMTVMRIGKIGDFLWDEPSYIKGQIIRLEDLGDDYHMAVTIAEEINKGVYI